MDIPELGQLKALLPQRDSKGRFFWQDYVDRVTSRFDGLPAPDDSGSFVQGCLAAGCNAVPVMECRRAWERLVPPGSDSRDRTVLERRVRLGLFFAGSLRYLTHGACRLRVRAGDDEWHPLRGERLTYRAFVEARDREPDVTWSKAAPNYGQVCVLAQFFLHLRETTLLGFDMAQDVYNHLKPDDPTGLFSIMLSDDGQVEEGEVDVAGVFLAALAQAVDEGLVRINTRVNGHLFVTPAFWFLTSPVGVGDVTQLLRRRRQGRRRDFPRHEVIEALCSARCLIGSDPGGKGEAVRLCELYSDAWESPLQLNGLLILPGSLPGHCTVPMFDGTITPIEERKIGDNTG